MKEHAKMAGVGIVCAFLGLGAGMMISSEEPLDAGQKAVVGSQEESANLQTKTYDRDFDERRLETAAADPYDSEAVGREPDGDGKMIWISAELLEELSRSAGAKAAGQNLFSADGKIEEILKITDREKAVIQTAWRNTQGKLRELEASAMSSKVSDEGSVVTITVPDLSARTGEIGEAFGSEVRDSLGGNRSEAFLAVKQIDRMFSPGAGERTYRIEPEATGNGGWRYHMTLEGPGTRRVWVSETIPEEISHLTDVASIRRSLSDK